MANIETLREQVRGDVITPQDAGYDQVRAVYNAMHDRHPDVIVRAADDADVIAGVRFARDGGLELAVRGGGHSVPGYGTCEGGVVIDLEDIHYVRVDPRGHTARVGGGAILRDMDHATGAYGLATPAGWNGTTGVGGLTLGGGIGVYLGRKYGLTCDNLLSADVITANGERVTASKNENEDLFWALQGGGGNFGIVTSFEFRLHPVSNVVAGPILFELDSAPNVMRVFRDYIAEAPRELGGWFGFHIAPPLPFIPEQRHGDHVCIVTPSWCGPEDQVQKMLQPLRDAGSVIAEHVGPVPYPAIQGAFDALLPPGLQHYWKSDFVADLDDEAIRVHMEYGPKVPVVNSGMHLYPMDGAVHDIGPDETAFPVRDGRFAMVIAGAWPDPADNEQNIAWVRDYYRAIHPHTGYNAGYANFMAADDEGRVRDNYGSHYERLKAIKARWDPHNVFHLNQNILPAAA